MAHPSLSVNHQTDKSAHTARMTKQAAGKSQTSFADVMAREETVRQDGKTAARANSMQTRPRVANLPDAGGIPLRGNIALAGRTPNELLRMQTFNKATADLTRTRALDSVARPGASISSLDIARNLNTASNLRTIAAGGHSGKGFALAESDFIRTAPRTNAAERVRQTRKAANKANNVNNNAGIGKLSAKFESGSDGIAAIGYDGTGGTSYGKYQIASKVGSMKAFLTFLDAEAPDLANRLRNAGPANTGSRKGAMPDEWRAIAKEQPERFEQLQEAYIHQSHYQPALAGISQKTGIDPNNLSPAMREVIWSTAVQHGPTGATRLFERADEMSGSADDASYERKMIANVYTLRAGQFGSSTPQVRDAVRRRFREEKELALNMLNNAGQADMA